MPQCDGIPPDGCCPLNVNNRTVKLTQGDLVLCPSCDGIRFPPLPSAGTTVSTNQRSYNIKKLPCNARRLPGYHNNFTFLQFQTEVCFWCKTSVYAWQTCSME